MDPWTIGIVAVLVVGVAVIAYGALADRRRNKRAAVEMLSPPDRDIPHFSPDNPAPTYLSELQARRRPTSARSTDLSAAERESIARRLKDPTTTCIPVGMASLDFVTDKPSTWAVLDRPYVLVCAQPVSTVREIIGPMEKVLPTGFPLVIVTPALLGEVRGTLEVNAIQHTMGLLGIEAAEDDLQRIAALTGAAAIPRDDLQSGYASLDRLGRCDRWVSTPSASYLLPSAGAATSGDYQTDDDRRSRP